MGPLQLGTLLALRYRVERFVSERNGVALYEAFDTVRSCVVGVKIIRHAHINPTDLAFDKFKLEAWEPYVVDYGNARGVPFFVTTEWDRTPRPAPPPLPPRASARPEEVR